MFAILTGEYGYRHLFLFEQQGHYEVLLHSTGPLLTRVNGIGLKLLSVWKQYIKVRERKSYSNININYSFYYYRHVNRIKITHLEFLIYIMSFMERQIALLYRNTNILTVF